MGLLKTRDVPTARQYPSLVASAVRMTLKDSANSWKGYRFADEAWQNQGWDFYDTNGQLHNAVDYVGAACSLIRLYVAHVDDYGVMQGEVDDDADVAALADALFGGPAAKAEIQRSLGESLTVAGECYLIGRTNGDGYGDKWMVIAPSEVRRQGSKYTIMVGHGQREELDPAKDVIVRVWTPHPRRPLVADSPVRALLPLLSEMEMLQQTLRAQLSSRIANAVVWVVPDTLMVPKGDGEPSLAADIYEQFMEVVTSNIEGHGTAAQIAPIMMPVPLAEMQAMAGVPPLRFESVMDEQAIALREECTKKLAIGINVPVEIQLGSAEMNHWGVWFAGEEFITKSIMPIMGRVVDAMTTAYLYPALKLMGKDPAKYTYWYDVAPLASSANKLIDTINMAKDGYVSDDTVRAVANYNKSDAPSEEESNRKFARELLLRDPTLAAVPEWRELAGIQMDIAMPALGELGMSTPPPPPPVPESLPQGPRPGQKPAPEATDGLTTSSDELTAAVHYPSPAHVAANSAVIRALELAGKRMLTPAIRKSFGTEPPVTLHTKVRVIGSDYAESLLAGAWDYLPSQMEGTRVKADVIRPVLDTYTKGLLLRSIEHNRSLLSAMLVAAGID